MVDVESLQNLQSNEHRRRTQTICVIFFQIEPKLRKPSSSIIFKPPRLLKSIIQLLSLTFVIVMSARASPGSMASPGSIASQPSIASSVMWEQAANAHVQDEDAVGPNPSRNLPPLPTSISEDGSETGLEVTPSEIQLELDRIILRVAKDLANMEVVNPEVVRVTPVFQVFQQGAVALRESEVDFYFKSQSAVKISTFWSHSWHGSRWNKIITLITIYNGPAAAVSGMVSAVVAMILYCFEVLPGLDRGREVDGVFYPYSCWSLWFGFIATTLVTIFWQPRKRVFLDRICISSTNQRLKTEAIFSLGGLLKHSDSMLVLWDPTWTERLWCLFELAAFLQSKKDQKKQLLIRPTFLGPMRISFFLVSFAGMIPLIMVPIDVSQPIFQLAAAGGVILCASVVSYVAMSTLRSYFRDLDIMKQQLLDVSFDTARSSCCDNDHVGSGGGRMLCDRKIVKECVNQWFGSQEVFEHTLRSEILDILTFDLAKRAFTTKSTLAMFMPIMWAFMDYAASDARFGATQYTPAFLLDGLSIWLVFMPMLKDVLIFVGEVTRARPKSLFMEIVKNSLLASMSLLLPAMIVMGTYVGMYFTALRDDALVLLRAGIFFACMLLYSMLTWCMAAGVRAISS